MTYLRFRLKTSSKISPWQISLSPEDMMKLNLSFSGGYFVFCPRGVVNHNMYSILSQLFKQPVSCAMDLALNVDSLFDSLS